MKKTILSFSLAILSVFAIANSRKGKTNEITINTKISSVEWIGKKVTGQHTGTINIKEGKLILNDGALVGGIIKIDMTTINNTDMQGEWKGKLEGHLNSPDFFDVEKYKEANLEIKSTTLKEGKTYIVKGDLTIKGITKPIEFLATIEVKDGKLGAFAEMAIDRTEYNIKYGSGKFFEGLGDKMISDEFIIKFKIAAE